MFVYGIGLVEVELTVPEKSHDLLHSGTDCDRSGIL